MLFGRRPAPRRMPCWACPAVRLSRADAQGNQSRLATRFMLGERVGGIRGGTCTAVCPARAHAAGVRERGRLGGSILLVKLKKARREEPRVTSVPLMAVARAACSSGDLKSAFLPSPGKLVTQWLDQVGQGRAGRGLDADLDGHAGDQL